MACVCVCVCVAMCAPAIGIHKNQTGTVQIRTWHTVYPLPCPAGRFSQSHTGWLASHWGYPFLYNLWSLDNPVRQEAAIRLQHCCIDIGRAWRQRTPGANRTLFCCSGIKYCITKEAKITSYFFFSYLQSKLTQRVQHRLEFNLFSYGRLAGATCINSNLSIMQAERTQQEQREWCGEGNISYNKHAIGMS